MYFDNNPFVINTSSESRLSHWKTIRKTIADLPERDALRVVAEYWSYAPLVQHSYDPENPSEWPTPWEMVSRGKMCRDFVALAMEQTLRLAGWDYSRMKLVYLRDYDISEELMLLNIDGMFALNYKVGEVIEYPRTEQIITHVWQFNGKEYVETTF